MSVDELERDARCVGFVEDEHDTKWALFEPSEPRRIHQTSVPKDVHERQNGDG
jgi:hypothetical protein